MHHLEIAYPAEQRKRIFDDPGQRQRAIEAFLVEQSVLEKAHQVGLDREEAFRKANELLDTRLLAHQATEHFRLFISEQSRLRLGAVEAQYEAHRHALGRELVFSFRQVLGYIRGNPAFPERGVAEANALAKARRARTDLRRSRSWSEVAKTYSDDLATAQRGGLIRDAAFGCFPKEVEAAIRSQPTGNPSPPIRTLFGYHILEVVDRSLERRSPQMDEVRTWLVDQDMARQMKMARDALMVTIEREVVFQLIGAGRRDTSLLDSQLIPLDAMLDTDRKTNVYESEFQWFLRNSFIRHQRVPIFSLPGSRQRLLRSFLDMLLLAEKARREALDQTASFRLARERAHEHLIQDFMHAREISGARAQLQAMGRRLYLETWSVNNALQPQNVTRRQGEGLGSLKRPSQKADFGGWMFCNV